MSIQPDSWIKKMCKEYKMIDPFIDHQISDGKISYGLSSMGYDVRISDEYRIFTNVNTSLVDPKIFQKITSLKKEDHIVLFLQIPLLWLRLLNTLKFLKMYFVFA